MTCFGKKKKVVLAVGLVVSCLFGQVFLHEGYAAEISEKTTQNKLILLESVLKKSKRPKEVYASGNDQAIVIMNEAQKHYDAAKSLLEKGEYQKSDSEIQKSLQKISKSFRMVVDKETETEVALEQYDMLYKRVKSFRDLFSQLPAEKAKGLMDVNEVDQLIVKSKSLYQQKQPQKAIVPLTKAADQLEKALSDARKNETVVYALEFATPEDEYKYELERNKNYLELTNIILSSNSPDIQKKLPLLKMLIKKNNNLINNAEDLLKKGDIKQAIELLEKGNKTLVQALRIGGLTL